MFRFWRYVPLGVPLSVLHISVYDMLRRFVLAEFVIYFGRFLAGSQRVCCSYPTRGSLGYAENRR